MKSFLKTLGQDPHASLTLFLKGLGLFAIGALFIYIGLYHHHYWQIVGIAFLTVGSCISAWGYLGIFINRLKNITQRNNK